MIAQLTAATLRILTFRAGPQDFPYQPGLRWPLVLFAGLANLLIFVQVLPVPSALAMAATMVGVTAVVTRSILRARGLVNRFDQTFGALMTTSGVLTLMLIPLFASTVPVLQQIAEHPEMLEQQDQLPFPPGSVFLMNLINFWNFAVTASIFRHAANVNLWVGLLIALVIAFIVLFAVGFAGTLVGVAFGV